MSDMGIVATVVFLFIGICLLMTSLNKENNKHNKRKK